jgi:hypothetical protein
MIKKLLRPLTGRLFVSNEASMITGLYLEAEGGQFI